MSTLTRPRGPLPARVYWFRRLLVLAVAFALVFGVARLLGSSGGPESDEAAQVVGATTTGRDRSATGRSTDDAAPGQEGAGAAAQSDDTRSDEKAGKKAEKRKAKAKKTRTPLAEPTGPCRARDVVVTPKPPKRAYAGSKVAFRIEVTTIDTPACTWKVRPSSVVVKLTSGPDRIWSSQDCPLSVRKADVVARQEVPGEAKVVWRGRRSDGTCTNTAAWAQPGWYHVKAAAFGSEPTDVQFELRPPVRKTITPKPRPEKKKSESGEETAGQG